MAGVGTAKKKTIKPEGGTVMCCQEIFASAEQASGKRQKMLRLFALFFCVFYIVVTLLSATCILTHANHTHDNEGSGGSCATCMHIASAENLLKALSTAVAAVGISLCAFALIISLCSRYIMAEGYSLVSLKVRLNN
jgi:hypothetical protein